MSTAAPAAAGAGAATAEAARRRTFAIISHPDAGKTTLTEKLLLYGGAVREAGAVKAHRGRRSTTSDWMELERRRGISVSSTVLRFEHAGTVFNLLDTPGHRDFSEDTLRVLAAADSAVILLDAARGVEEQTLRLFQVARARRIPLITFVNKYDRPGREPLEMIDHVEATLEVAAPPLTWPVGRPGDFAGVVDRATGGFHRYDRTVGGATMGGEEVLDDAAALAAFGDDWRRASEELELLDGVGAEFDATAFLAGELSPVFFGSALSNFGVPLLLDALVARAPAPLPRPTADGGARPLDAPFSAVAFKVQANMDPRHRDRIAFVRVCSGRFERGMRAINARTGRTLALDHAHEVFARERSVVEDAYPGDVVGIVNAADVRVGDSLYVEEPVRFPPIPTLAPEHFMSVRNRDASRHKQFRRGLAQLDEEGVIHLLRRVDGDPVPVLGAVGRLQFEVAIERLRAEFGVEVGLDPAPWTAARRIGPDAVDAVRAGRRASVLIRTDDTHLAVFETDFALEWFARDHPGVALEAIVAG